MHLTTFRRQLKAKYAKPPGAGYRMNHPPSIPSDAELKKQLKLNDKKLRIDPREIYTGAWCFERRTMETTRCGFVSAEALNVQADAIERMRKAILEDSNED